MDKLFVIGYNKTGTKSLAKALEILGYRVLHTGGGGAHLEKIGWNMYYNNPILDGLDEYECYIDYPIFEPTVFSHIVHEYPSAKYISLTRNLDDYIESVLKDKIKRLDDGVVDSWNWLGVGDKEVFENYPEYQKDWITGRTKFKHYSNLSLLKKNNIELLDMNICDNNDGWNKLCDFLYKEIPNMTFPHYNKSE
jgi:hypothetical protein